MPLDNTELARQKQSMRATSAAAKVWHTFNVPTPQAAVDLTNDPPAQVAGEASFTNKANGSVDVYLFF